MYTAKPTIKRIKSQVTVWRKYLQMYKRIPFKIYEELKNSKIRKRVHCFFKSGHRCARWVTTEDTCQLSTWEMSMYFVRQMQIKTGTDHCPSVNTRPASSILRTLKTGEDIEWEKFIRGWWDVEMAPSLKEASWQILKELTHSYHIFSPWCLPLKWKCMSKQKPENRHLEVLFTIAKHGSNENAFL